MTNNYKDCDLNDLFRLVNDFGERLTQHMQDEAKQDAQIMNAIAKLDHRLDEIESKVDSLTVLQIAFPENEDGDLDLLGHKKDHVDRRKAYVASETRWKTIKDKWIEKLMDAAILCTFLLLGYGIVGWLQATTNIVVK